jgi:hypothetical protein
MYSWMPKFGTQVSKCKRRAHAHGRQVGGASGTRSHAVQRREVRDAPHVRDAAAVHDGRADVVDELVLDQVLAVPDRIEHFADGEWRHVCLRTSSKDLLVFRGGRVFHPEQAIRLERATKRAASSGVQPVMHVVQQLDLGSVILAQALEKFRHDVEVLRVDHTVSAGSSLSAGSYAVLRFEMP